MTDCQYKPGPGLNYSVDVVGGPVSLIGVSNDKNVVVTVCGVVIDACEAEGT